MANVERPDIEWRKSPASAGGDCVEVGFDDDVVLVRDSSDPGGPRLAFTRSQWSAFLTGVRTSDSFDHPDR